MAHRTLRGSYGRLEERLNRFPQGAPPSDLLFQILALLFSEREAELVATLPIRPFTAEAAARLWGRPLGETERALDELAGRGILLDSATAQGQRYVLPPPMAGFFEFSLMRVRGDIDQALLSELFYQYLNVEEEFVRELFTEGETQLGRTFVNEDALPEADDALHVLDFERASHVAKTAEVIGLGLCYCRHKMQHLGRACDAPLEICMTFGGVADSLTRHEVARRIDASECLDLLAQARERSLVQFGENVRSGVSFICNCCGCCCEALIAQRRFASLRPVHTTRFIPEVSEADCNGCGKCIDACPVEALSLVSANDPARPKKRRAQLDAERCLGCGVCVPACRESALRLVERGERVLTPLNTAHRTVLMAIERGQLQHLLFDEHERGGHRALAAILGVVLRLSPVKRALASDQLGSRYFERLLERWS